MKTMIRVESLPWKTLVLSMCSLAVAATNVAAESPSGDLLRFLPNDGNTVYTTGDLLREWPEGGPKELWNVEIGHGKSAVSEASGLAFTATETDEKQYAIALDPQTGATKWKTLLLAKKNRHFA